MTSKPYSILRELNSTISMFANCLLTKEILLSFDDANYRVGKMTAACQLNGIDKTKSPTFWQDGFLEECMWGYFTEL